LIFNFCVESAGVTAIDVLLVGAVITGAVILEDTIALLSSFLHEAAKKVMTAIMIGIIIFFISVMINSRDFVLN